MSHQPLLRVDRARQPGLAASEDPRARTPVLPKPPQVRATVHIRVDRCKGCELCIEYCPANVLALSSEFNTKGYHYPVLISNGCIACQGCLTICPEFAIFAVPEPT